MHEEPAAGIIRLLGGLSAVARATGTTVTTVQRWRRSTDLGGSGGYIPVRHHKALMAFADTQGIELPRLAFLEASAVPEHPRPKRGWGKHGPYVPFDLDEEQAQ